ncbi:MAG: hypothetical protein EBZ49_17625, partial [Proteobacteria bacterium]|nr:hypothetical protein [Pseudomonadota bacterium]
FEQNIELAERLFGLMKQDIEERNKMAETKEKFTDRRWEIEEEIRQARKLLLNIEDGLMDLHEIIYPSADRETDHSDD